MTKISKYEENPKLLSSLKGVHKIRVKMSVAYATRSLKLSRVLYILGFHTQTFEAKRNGNQKKK